MSLIDESWAASEDGGPDAVRSSTNASLADLETRVRRDLNLSNYPDQPWVPERPGILNVAIIGGGQSGLATAFGLARENIGNVRIFDRSENGFEGPWVTFARMLTLRTPKHLTGPDIGFPSLTPRAWFEARYGAEAWNALGKISRLDWQAYLGWFRRVLDLPVDNATEVTYIAPHDHDGEVLLKLTLKSGGQQARISLARWCSQQALRAPALGTLRVSSVTLCRPIFTHIHRQRSISSGCETNESACWGLVVRRSTVPQRRLKRGPRA
jgi:FAD-NAD(P)-binding